MISTTDVPGAARKDASGRGFVGAKDARRRRRGNVDDARSWARADRAGLQVESEGRAAFAERQRSSGEKLCFLANLLVVEECSVAAAEVLNCEGRTLASRNADSGVITADHVIARGVVDNVARWIATYAELGASFKGKFFDLVRLGARNVTNDNFM